MAERCRKQTSLRQGLAKTQFANAQGEEQGREERLVFRAFLREPPEMKWRGTPGKRRPSQTLPRAPTAAETAPPSPTPSSSSSASSLASSEAPVADDDDDITILPGMSTVGALGELSKGFRPGSRVPLAAMMEVHAVAERHGVLRGISGLVAALAIANFTARTHGQKPSSLFFRDPTLDHPISGEAAEQAHNVLWLHRRKFQPTIERRLRRAWTEPQMRPTGRTGNLEKLSLKDRILNEGWVPQVPNPLTRVRRKVGTEWWRYEMIGEQEWEDEEEGGVAIDPSSDDPAEEEKGESTGTEQSGEGGDLAERTEGLGLGISM